ncbi:WD40-repeat-containing domain protein [Pisolithus marmoratus]|nr:WD40-repeat-containing domain protein [Pisolithus marmoratus]
MAPLGDIDPLKRILREVHLWSKLRRDNHRIGTAMGYAHSYVKSEEIDPRPLLVDIASGLYYLHSHSPASIFHGDSKGLDVVVSSDRRAQLSGFGLTIEILRDMIPSREGGVWAFGMAILELFTRSIPFHECGCRENVMWRIWTNELPSCSSEESTLCRMTDPWWETCMSCWRREPSSRFLMKELLEKAKGFTNPAGHALMLPQVSLPVMPFSKDTLPRVSPYEILCHCNRLRRRFTTFYHRARYWVLVQTLRGHTDKVAAVAFSPDGKRIVSGSADISICLWDMQTRTRVGSPLRGHVGWASVAFSRDGEWVMTGSYDGAVGLSDVHRGALVELPLRGHSAKVLLILFSSDGRTVVSGSSNRTIYVWDVPNARAT